MNRDPPRWRVPRVLQSAARFCPAAGDLSNLEKSMIELFERAFYRAPQRSAD